MFFILVLTLSLGAQATATVGRPAGEADLLAQGWAALGEQDFSRASRLAAEAQARSPRSAAALALSIEIEIVRAGPAAALDSYERWLGAKRIDEAYVLRRIAEAYLRAAARQTGSVARLEAIKALAAEGETSARQDLASNAGAANVGETRLLAALGDERAVRSLIAQLRSAAPNKLMVVQGLVDSGSRLAVAPLVELLGDSREELRAAAADGLGRLGDRDSIDRLKPLLQDGSFAVRMAAAGALYRLEDYSGLTLLQQLLSSEHAAVRLGAAEAMASRPDPTWISIVRELTREADSTVRLNAARLLAPYDRETAEATLAQLRQHENLAIQQEAARVTAKHVAGDFAALRKLLRDHDPLTAVRAADRILELTR